MKPLHLLTLGATMAAMAVLAAPAGAQQRSVSGGARITVPSHSNHFSWERGDQRFRGGFPVFVVEREVPVIVEVPVAPPPPPAVPLPTPSAQGGTEQRKPYVIGASYASLPGSCMKLIEEGVSFYYCSGEWYRQVGEGRGATYKAVARRL